MTRRRGGGRAAPLISLPLVILYAFFALAASPFPEANPGKAGGTSAGMRAGQSESGLAGNIGLAGEVWTDDDVDACHSSPANRQSDEAAPFALVGSESLVRKSVAAAATCPLGFNPLFALAWRPASSWESLAHPDAGPRLPFPHAWPVFLISDLPPPLPA